MVIIFIIAWFTFPYRPTFDFWECYFYYLLLFGLLLVFTFEVIVISCMVYILSIPISIYHYMKLKKKYSITSGNEDDELEDVL